MDTIRQAYGDDVAPFAGAWIEIWRKRSNQSFLQSLPSRERGLKSRAGDRETTASGSLPSRERGLKFYNNRVNKLRELSLPSRERGLKLM